LNRVAVLASGGMESTYVALERLRDTDDEVTLAFLTSFQADTSPAWRKRYDAEWRCLRNIVAWFYTNARPVNFDRRKLTSFRSGGWWGTEAIFWAAEQCNAGRFDEVLVGWNGTESRGENSLRSIQEAIFARYATRGRLTFALGPITRAEVYYGLPTDLRAMTVSCLSAWVTDGRIHSCESCLKCERILVLERSIQEGVPLSEARQRYMDVLAAQAEGAKTYSELYPNCELFNLLA